MKLNKKLIAVSALLSTLSLSHSALAGIEDDLANICNIVISNDKSELRKKMKNVQSDYQMRLSDYYDGITCNGNSLIRTAILNDAVDTGTLLVKKMPKSKLQEPETDGMLLAAWIETNGKSDSPISSALTERL